MDILKSKQNLWAFTYVTDWARGVIHDPHIESIWIGSPVMGKERRAWTFNAKDLVNHHNNRRRQTVRFLTWITRSFNHCPKQPMNVNPNTAPLQFSKNLNRLLKILPDLYSPALYPLFKLQNSSCHLHSTPYLNCRPSNPSSQTTSIRNKDLQPLHLFSSMADELASL